MKAKLEINDTVLTLVVSKEDFGKLFKTKLEHVWVEYFPTANDDNSQAGIQAFRIGGWLTGGINENT